MTRLALMMILLMHSMSAMAETSICDGLWENGAPVHVVVNWNKGKVNVNGIVTKILGTESSGIFTDVHINKSGHRVLFVILISKYGQYNANGVLLYDSVNQATFVAAVDMDDKEAKIMSRGLYCSKSFTRPLMARLL